MKKRILFFLYLISSVGVRVLYAQEGRPALAAETTESQRIKTIIKDAFPHDLENWQIEDESKTDGETWFHDGGMAAKTPFTHEFKIIYTRKNISDAEREKWKKIAVDEAGIQKMMDETQFEVQVLVNSFRLEFTSKKIQNKVLSPFNLVFVGQHGAKLLMGNGWKITKDEDLEDGGRRDYVVETSINRSLPMTQIQTIQIETSGSPEVLDFFLKNIKIKDIQALIGQNKITHITNNQSVISEKAFLKPLEGKHIIEFTLNGGDFSNRTFKLKHSAEGEFGYLNNFHPNPNITDNAVTRILIQEDDDFTTKNKTGFLDITIPFIRRTGKFEIYPNAEKATFAGGINCWDGCEYSFDAEKMVINISKYDPVGGYIEGTFEGEVKVRYKVNQPIDNEQKYRPEAQIKGKFKVHRKADRY